MSVQILIYLNGNIEIQFNWNWFVLPHSNFLNACVCVVTISVSFCTSLSIIAILYTSVFLKEIIFLPE